MPVSKKRKKSGKPVKRAAATPAEAGHEGAEAKPAHPPSRAGKPSNPFVAQHQVPRGAQRGR
ncbi:MAG TPA: hypothetical protein VFK85_00820 [Anaeromyxobacteraceae bacterium]|nr:hypothetical protein [Anaeromyxobacteraceae bacterium]